MAPHAVRGRGCGCYPSGPGRVAQRESARLTRERSQVQYLPRPQGNSQVSASRLDRHDACGLRVPQTCRTNIIEPLGEIDVERREQVPVQVQRRRDRRMTQTRLDRLRMCALGDCQRGCRVSQVVVRRRGTVFRWGGVSGRAASNPDQGQQPWPEKTPEGNGMKQSEMHPMRASKAPVGVLRPEREGHPAIRMQGLRQASGDGLGQGAPRAAAGNPAASRCQEKEEKRGGKRTSPTSTRQPRNEQ
jgi:hypothetical protein